MRIVMSWTGRKVPLGTTDVVAPGFIPVTKRLPLNSKCRRHEPYWLLANQAFAQKKRVYIGHAYGIFRIWISLNHRLKPAATI